MARSVSYGRHTTSVRSKTPSTKRASTNRRHRASSKVDIDPPPLLPDVDELRRLRQAYYTLGPAREKRAPRATGAASVEEHNANRSKRKRRSRPTGDGPSRSPYAKADRTSEYVYATAVATSDEELRSGRARRASRASTEDANGLSTIPEAVVTPDDSVSQKGARRRRSRRLNTTLRAVPEQAAKSSQVSPRTTIDSLFGSIFSRRKSTATTGPALVDCLTCGADDTPIAKSAKLECGHKMCHSCLKRLFKLAVHDPAHMPPRCCTEHPIPLKHVDKLFDLRFKLQFNKKFDEYRTKDRIYCPNRRCGIWIRPANYHSSSGRRYGQCRRCKTKACLHCGLKLHKSQDCPKDPETVKFAEEAEKQGWKRCHSCNAMVELRDGCNHMTCRCMAEFCMVCGAKWKSCDCPLFSPGAIPAMGDGLPDFFEFLQRHIWDPVIHENAQQEPEARPGQERIDEDLAQRMRFAAIR